MLPGASFTNTRGQSWGTNNRWGNDGLALPPTPGRTYPTYWLQILSPWVTTGTNPYPWEPGVLKQYSVADAWGYGGIARARTTIYWCSQDPRQTVGTGDVSNPDNGNGVSYAPLGNAWPSTSAGYLGTVLGHKFPTLGSPGDAAMFIEARSTNWLNNGSNGNIGIPYCGYNYTNNIPNDFPGQTLASFRFRHMGLCNVVYADGHVGSLKPGPGIPLNHQDHTTYWGDVPPPGTAAAPQRFWGFGVDAWGY